ncbi:MAG: DNA polymerase III subunit gamma/tau [Ruminococcaceae bacterium]|nr:DNA polymerase III subunit gamma/tau [Oscillospiraceae bacterium]
MHQAFYRKWRPQTFDDVYGQEHITSVLRYETENGAFSHAYLFCGSRGTGKTTCAKILAKAVNCEGPINGSPCCRCASCLAIDSGAATDVLEMDAASNNGVDNIRDIRDEVVYAPSSLKKRVYIIDEVHMLSVSAFNALLKTLEEPPEHVVFVLATTELQKLPATIISRCQRFDFRRISTEMLMKRLAYIAEREELELDSEASRMIAKLAQGGMRDAISLLELCSGSSKKITLETVIESVGATGRDSMVATVNAIAAQDYDLLFGQIEEVVRSSKDLAVFWQNLISFYRDMLVVKNTTNAAAYLDLTDHETEQIKLAASKFRKETLLYHCKLLEQALYSMQKANAVKRVVAELTLVRMCDESLDQSNEALLSRIAKLEDAVILGGWTRTAPTVAHTATEENPTVAPVSEEGKNAEATTAAQPRQQVGQSEAGAKRVLRPLRNWMEVVERIGAADPMMSSFCRSASAFVTEQNEILVRFSSRFAMDMAQKGAGKERLIGALAVTLKREIAEKELLLEVASNSSRSMVDEIVEMLIEE